MRTKYWDQINLAKIAGLNQLLTIEIIDDCIRLTLFRRKTGLIKYLTKPILINDFSIIFSDIIEKDLTLLPSIIKSYLQKHKIKELYILIGIIECRYFKIVIPSDIDDDDLWFIENTDKFLPEGKPNSEFAYSYQKINEDEYSRNYLVVTARKDYIESIIKACDVPSTKILNIQPFHSSILYIKEYIEDVSIFLVFLNTRMMYTYRHAEGNFDIGELFYGNYGDISQDGIVEGTLQRYLLSFPFSKSVQNIKIILSCSPSIREKLKTVIIQSIHLNVEFVECYNDLSVMSAAYSIVSTIDNIDSQINMIDAGHHRNGRHSVEKKIWLNIISIFGVVLIVLILISYSLSYIINDIQLNQKDISTSLLVKQKELTKLENENKYYSSNIRVLNLFKNKKGLYTHLLQQINYVTGNNVCLTGIEIKGEKESLYLSLKGIAKNQMDVAELLKKISETNGISNISLIYSSPFENNDFSEDKKPSYHNYIQYNIKCNYNENY